MPEWTKPTQVDNCCHTIALYIFAHTESTDTSAGARLPFHISLAARYRNKTFACMGSFRIKDYNFFLHLFLSLDVSHGEYMQLFHTVFKWMYMTHREGFSVFS